MPDIMTDATALSHFSFYWGVLAESTQEKNQRILHVFVPALTPMRNGDISDKGSITTVDLFNVMKQERELSEIHLSRTIEAEYLGFQSGQDVPDMYKGQQVLVLNYARGDRWFWIPLERDNYLKTFEHAKIRCADIATVHKVDSDKLSKSDFEDIEREESLTDDNTYFLEIDTKYNKRIFLSTAASDGEKYRYFINMDAKAHVLEIWDSLASEDGKTSSKAHNTIRIESDPKYADGTIMKGRITVQNEAGTTLKLEDKDLEIIVPRDLTFIVGRNSIVNVGSSSSVVIQGNSSLKIVGNVLREILGTLKASIRGAYSYIFGQTRVEEVLVDYTLKSKNQINIFETRTTSINKSDNLTVDGAISISSISYELEGKNQISLNSDKLISFASRTVTTSAHIYGCCGCKAH